MIIKIVYMAKGIGLGTQFGLKLGVRLRKSNPWLVR